MEVFFQMRFSYCGKPGGLVRRRGTAPRGLTEAEVLRQFEVLERLTLPSLRDQDDPSFRLILLTSARMPQAGKDHLTWLLNHYLPGRSHVEYARPMIPGRVFRRYMQGIGHGEAPVVQTQVLEGDAFGRRFVQKLREHAIESWAATPESGGTFMSFKRGLNLRLERRKPVGLEVTTAPVTPFGLSLVARPSGRYNPALINPDGLGVKLPHVSIRTRSLHCMRAVGADDVADLPPVEARILAEAQQEFSVLRAVHAIPTTEDQRLKAPVDVSHVGRLRRSA